MTDEKPENIDKYFKDQFEEIEVRYNAAHWSQLQSALAGAAAVGAVAITPESFWMRLMKFFKNQQRLFLIAATSIILMTSIYFLVTSKSHRTLPTMWPQESVEPESEPVFYDEMDTVVGFSTRMNDTLTLSHSATQPLPLDSFIISSLTYKDSIDSVHVDSNKVDKLFIFW